MYFYGDIEPPKRLGYAGSPRLGLQEGEARLKCPPGQVKAYLPEWPYQKCVPAEEMLEPRPGQVSIAPEPEVPQGAPVPSEAPPQAAPEPVPPTVPGRARLLDVDPETGEALDPDTGQPVVERAYVLSESAQPVVGAVLGLGAFAFVLWAIGAFK